MSVYIFSNSICQPSKEYSSGTQFADPTGRFSVLLLLLYFSITLSNREPEQGEKGHCGITFWLHHHTAMVRLNVCGAGSRKDYVTET